MIKRKFFLLTSAELRDCFENQYIVGKVWEGMGGGWGGVEGRRSTPSFFKSSPFLEILDGPTFYRPVGKTKVLDNSFSRFLYNFYPQSILILQEYLHKWRNTNLI